MSARWYALRVKPHKERSVYERLRLEAIEAFFPEVRVRPVNPRARKQKPYFPGYMFVRTDLADVAPGMFNWMPGALGLVTFGDIPAAVPDNLIYELQKQLAEIEAQGGVDQKKYKKGERVRIVSGPFTGYEAIFDTHLSGQDRVQVLLTFLSRYPQPTQLDRDDIEKAPKR
jgi:transcription antitermination factor NusG